MRFIISCVMVLVMWGCNNQEKGPDVSKINIPLTTQRFEQDLFSLDTNNLAPGLDKLIAKYPSFGENFLTTILNVDPRWTPDTTTNYIKGFISSYWNVYDSSRMVFKDFSPYENEIKEGLQYVHHYYPAYKIPRRIITYIGPLDGYGDILDEDVIIVGLHHHLGSGFSLYRASWVQQIYPAYISNRFEPGQVSVNSLKNIVLDLYPEKTADRSLVVQMVEKGKRLYLLSRFLPNKEEYRLIGYTEKQLKESYDHEAAIWDLFVQNNFLQSIDNNLIKNYIGESPKTQELGEASPGNIGSFSGWQIVKTYMQKYPATSLQDLMAMDPEKLFREAKYKP